jgi:hypothetical protein
MRNTVDSSLLLFGSLSLFHIIGAVVPANALRESWHGLREGDISGCQVVFTTIWATIFGGLPFLFGVQFARSADGTILFLLGEVLVWTMRDVCAAGRSCSTKATAAVHLERDGVPQLREPRSDHPSPYLGPALVPAL